MPTIKPRLWLMILSSILAFVYGLGSAQDNRIGRVVGLQGQATVRHLGASQTVLLSVDRPVFQEDIIRTAAASKIILMLVNDTEIRLGEHGTLVLSRAVYTPERNSTLLTVVKGIFRVITSPLPSRAAFEVHTTTAVAAVRGTDWLGDVTATATGMVVQEGEVVVRNVDPAPGQPVILTAGMGTDVLPGQAPSAPKKWGEARLQALQQATAWP